MRHIKALLLLFVASVWMGASAQGSVNPDAAQALEPVYSRYSQWQSVELSGKLTVSSLPLRPSVKIFMQRGSRLLVSVTAPFVGEVGRVDLTRDSVLLINRMRKTYCREATGQLFRICPTALSDIQDVLLGRVFSLDKGTLSAANADDFEVYECEEPAGALMAIPDNQTHAQLFTYGFQTDASGMLSLLIATIRGDRQLQVAYDYRGKKSVMDVAYESSSRSIAGSLELNEPKWNAVPFAASEPGRNFRRLNIREFLKSF